LRNALVLLAVLALMIAAGGCGGSGENGGVEENEEGTELAVTSSSLLLSAGRSWRLTAENYEGELAWETLDESVAAVTGDGAAAIVAAIGEGRTSIVVTDGSGATAECAVAVTSGFSILPTNGNWADVADTSWYTSGVTDYEISTAEQLAGLAKLVNDKRVSSKENYFYGTTFTLTDNIVLSIKGL
jgi:hypothetical protein